MHALPRLIQQNIRSNNKYVLTYVAKCHPVYVTLHISFLCVTILGFVYINLKALCRKGAFTYSGYTHTVYAHVVIGVS